MDSRRSHPLARSGVVALAAAAALTVLAGCDEQPYSTPTHTAAPAAQPSPELMGAPEAAVAPPEAQAPAYGPPAGAAYPPPAYSGRAYEPGAVVAMAPTPNPPEGGRDESGDRGRRVHARYETAQAAPTQNPVRSSHPAAGEQHASASAFGARGAYVPPRPPGAAETAQARRPASTPAPAQSKGVNTRAAAPQAPTRAGVNASAGSSALHARHAAAQAKTVGAKGGDHATRLAALQSALSDAIASSAVLSAPGSFSANQPRDVSLTIPAAFADTVRSEAKKDNLADAAASVRLNANLAGDGFLVTP